MTSKPKRRPRPITELSTKLSARKSSGPCTVSGSSTRRTAQVWAGRFWTSGTYLCSIRSDVLGFWRSIGEVRERRNQRRHPNYTKPELLAVQRRDQVWSWDITKLRGPVKWTYYYLYVILDIFSRYVVGWMLAHSRKCRARPTPHRRELSQAGLLIFRPTHPCTRTVAAR